MTSELENPDSNFERYLNFDPGSHGIAFSPDTADPGEFMVPEKLMVEADAGPESAVMIQFPDESEPTEFTVGEMVAYIDRFNKDNISTGYFKGVDSITGEIILAGDNVLEADNEVQDDQQTVLRVNDAFNLHQIRTLAEHNPILNHGVEIDDILHAPGHFLSRYTELKSVLLAAVSKRDQLAFQSFYDQYFPAESHVQDARSYESPAKRVEGYAAEPEDVPSVEDQIREIMGNGPDDSPLD